jgi:hypothetical protein
MHRDDPQKEVYETVARVLESHFQYGLTPAEAVDYVAVQKADIDTVEWAAIRDVEHSTVSGNVSGAKEKINVSRLDAETIEEEDKILVRVTDQDGEQHDLPFKKSTGVVGTDTEATLQLIYEAMSAVHGYYVGEDGEKFESTLWFDGRPTNGFEEFDFGDQWGSPKAKADTILWERTEE